MQLTSPSPSCVMNHRTQNNNKFKLQNEIPWRVVTHSANRLLTKQYHTINNNQQVLYNIQRMFNIPAIRFLSKM
jgi:hypothetical protein